MLFFWDNFYKSAEKNFLPDTDKHYFLISDQAFDKLPDNVTYVYHPHKEWPSITVEKFDIIYSLKGKLQDYTYTYFFNANTWFIQPIEGDILPSKTQKIIAGLHPNYYKTDDKYPYCSDKDSPAYLKQDENSKYYQACIMGGITEDFLKMAETIEQWRNMDLKRNYIPIWHDESYFNKYVSDKNPLVLTPNYLWGSFPSKEAYDSFKNQVKIVMIDKDKTNNVGMDYFRDIRFVNDNPESLSEFFYVSYQNGGTDCISFHDNHFYTKTDDKSGEFTQENDTYKFIYSTGEKKCFKEIARSSFFYEIKCP